MNIIIKNTTIVDKRSKFNNSNVDILIIDGIITEIKKNLNLDKHSSKIKIVDFKNCHVSPGWFDFHVNFCDPGFENRDTIENGINSSVKGGFTGVQIMPNTEPNIDNKSIIEYINNKSSDCIVDIFTSANITKKANGEDLVEMYDILKSGCKSFTDDKKSISNSKVLNLALEYANDLNTLILHHPSDKELINHGVVNEGVLSTKLGLKGIPNISEFLTTYRDIEINNYSKGKIHLSYISTSESVKLIRKQKKSENNITCDVSIYNTFLDESYVDNFDTRFKLEPPLRTKKDIKEIIKGLNDSTIDIITSDHTPVDLENKKIEFDHADSGIIGLESFFGLLIKNLGEHIDLETLIEKISVNPKQILKIDCPEIKVGEKANLTLFDPLKEWDFEETDIKSMSKNTPFINESLKGRPLAIYNNSKFKIC
jgi:dihydroorotase